MKPTDFAIAAACAAAAKITQCPASQIAVQIRASSMVQEVLKGAVPAATVSSSEWAGSIAGRHLATVFVESLRSVSVFERLRQDGMVPAPLMSPIIGTSQVFAASARAEGQAIPLSKMQLSSGSIARKSAGAITAISNTMLRSLTPTAIAFIERELRRATAAALDASFINIISNGATAIASTGTDFDALRLDVRALLEVVNVEGNGKLFWLMPPKIANSTATMIDAVGGQVGPAMTPAGGEFVGLPALVSSQVPANQVILADASRIAGDIETIGVETSENADIEMLDNPAGFSGSTPVASQKVSLFQVDATGIKSVAYFGVERTRPSAVAVLSGCAWGGAVPAE